ncbi:Hint domain-containing protein [Jannaschia sp. CCS1]|uniref:Hint domain-containing protein n=1 Tax=Jannaschia sp. (strain CCS1) TaxID=290400 RepID=UPI000053CBE5|nr:Hint domain-containing protein [Jannaschia sp. CCS1]ABD54014.1 hypothetical protein Jann_1097 [Jannaschia sp. CCS1]
MTTQSNNAPPQMGTLPFPIAAQEAGPASAPPHRALDAGTLVRTPLGVQPVKSLSVGDHLVTRSGTPAPITGIDHLLVSRRQMQDDATLAPIRFDPGALPGMPDAPAILVSPDCPIFRSADASDLRPFPARAFCDGGRVRRVIPDDGIHYIRLHFGAPHDICVGGVWMELGADTACGPHTSGQKPAPVPHMRPVRPHLAIANQPRINRA